MPIFRTIHGVDFSGAKEAGRNLWISTAVPAGHRLRLVELQSLEALTGHLSRDAALAALVELIASSRAALWGMDFPFALPIEVVDPGTTWVRQLALVRRWGGTVNEWGLSCVRRSQALCGKMHVRRTTDTETRTPFDCYHYRIAYQTFHGMRDVLLPLSTRPGACVMPFQPRKLPRARHVIAESCPGSTLRRLNLPYNNYKQPAGGPLTPRRRRTRHAILAGLRPLIDIPATLHARLMRNPGGDALDAVIAAVGVHHAWTNADHARIRRHARYPVEGYIYS